jgi:hypothetical protein
MAGIFRRSLGKLVRRDEWARSYRTLGPRRFWTVMIGGGSYAIALLDLMHNVIWPRLCSPEMDSRGLAKFAEAYRCSFGLLDGGKAEVALFFLLWLLPAGAAIRLVQFIWNRR